MICLEVNQLARPKVLVVIVGKVGSPIQKTVDSIKSQTFKRFSIKFANKRFSDSLPIGVRCGKAINHLFVKVDLSKYSHILRVDNDTSLPPTYLEKSLELNVDMVGIGGFAQLIRMDAFLQCFDGVYPEEYAEDSFVFYTLRVKGFKVVRERPVKPILPPPKMYSRKQWFLRGKSRYRFGYSLFGVCKGFRDKRQSTKVGLNVVYEIFGFLFAWFHKNPKYWFAKKRRFGIM